MKGHFTNWLVIDPASWRAGLLRIILRLGVYLGFLVYLPSVYFAIVCGLPGVVVLDTVAMAIVVAIYYFDRLPFRWRATGLCFTFYILAVGLLIWIGSISQIYLFGFSIITALLLGLRSGLVAALLSSATMFLVGWLGYAAPEMMIANWQFELSGWVIITLNFTLVNTLLTVAIGAVLAAVNNALNREIATRISLEGERKLLRTLIDAVPDIVFTKDTSGRFLNCNPATLTHVGLDNEVQLTGKTVFDLFPRDLAESFHAVDLQVLAGRRLLNQENRSVDSKGNLLWHLTIKVPLRDAAGAIIGLVGISRDITDQRKLQEQLRQSQKLEAIGRLAGGVAHDFNNLLTIISGYSESLLSRPDLEAGIRAPVTAIRDAGNRAAALTRQLLAFSRRSILQPKILDLNTVVAETGTMLRRLIGEDIQFSTVLDPNLGHVRVDPSQLDQVLMNLAVNARDVMPRGGRLTIETANVELSDDYATTHPECKAGRHVMLAMTDTGSGMTPEIKARIFEPFFTTKEVGQGTGLGLAMVFGVVQQSGGSIEVYSEPERGSTFKIYFPVEARPLSQPKAPPRKSEVKGTETILLVEDEEAVRGLVLMSLEMHGYKVLTAIDGQDALRVVEAHAGSIQLLLTDVVMPNLGGPALAIDLGARFPQMKILYMSGYTGDAVVRHGLLNAGAAFIQKPYTPLGLAQKVRSVLDEKRNAG